ncbi:hypothetical protein OG21DRAFT_1517570 [Imleria badia]|nr:hypothetical protein OG21DRAFT_1517570 [Imleria badia]
MIASATGRSFDDDEVAAHILSCIDLCPDAPHDLGLLCIVSQEMRESMIELKDTLYTIKDILKHHGIEIGCVFVDVLDVGYWIKATVKKSSWCEQWEGEPVTQVVEVNREQGVEKDPLSTDNGDADTSVVILPSSPDTPEHRVTPSRCGDTKQAQGPSGFVDHRHAPSSGSDEVHDEAPVSKLALAKTTWRVDVLGTSRRASIVRGWGNLPFVRTISLANRASHVIDHQLFVNDRPAAFVRTGSSSTADRPVMIVIAGTTGRPFDDDALVARILSCIDLDLDEPQDVGLLCVVSQNTREMVVALNETLDAIQDILEYYEIEVMNISVTELDTGYWIKVTMQKFIWEEEEEEVDDDEVPPVVEADLEDCEQGSIAEDASTSTEDEDANVVPLSDAKPKASVEGLVHVFRRWF